MSPLHPSDFSLGRLYVSRTKLLNTLVLLHLLQSPVSSAAAALRLLTVRYIGYRISDIGHLL